MKVSAAVERSARATPCLRWLEGTNSLEMPMGVGRRWGLQKTPDTSTGAGLGSP